MRGNIETRCNGTAYILLGFQVWGLGNSGLLAGTSKQASSFSDPCHKAAVLNTSIKVKSALPSI